MATPASIGEALTAYVDSRADYNRKLTLERVDAVLPDGAVMVRGARLPVAGLVALQPGMQVPVAWRDGRMEVVLQGTGRRTGVSASDVPAVALAVAEELVSEPPLFRDQRNFVSVDLAAAKAAAGITSEGVELKWGLGEPSYVVMRGLNDADELIYAVCRINRPQRERAFPTVKSVKLVLVRAYNLTTIGHSFGTAEASHSFSTGASITLPITYTGQAQTTDEMPAAGLLRLRIFVASAAVAPNGDLLVVVTLEVDAISPSFANDARLHAGSKVINVTKNAVVVNRMASTLTGSFVVPVGAISVTTDTGADPADSGAILALLSVKEANPTKLGTVNNYAVHTPAFVEGLPRPAGALRIGGEFAQRLETLAGGDVAVAETALVQGSRTMLVWAVQSGSQLRRLRIADLAKHRVSALAGDPNLMFGTRPPVAQPLTGFPASRALFLGRDDLIYSPGDLTSPFTRQFYWAGHAASGVFSIDLGRRVGRSDLQEVARRAAPGTAVERQAVLDGGGDLQVFQPSGS